MAKEVDILVQEFCRIIAGIVTRLLRKNRAGQDNDVKKEGEVNKK